MREFHISRDARDRYQFDQSLYSLSGNVIFANLHAVRKFTAKLNSQRDLARFPERAVSAGQINAMGLIDEILHYVVKLYQEKRNPEAMHQAYAYLAGRFSAELLDETLLRFSEEFPPLAVYQRATDSETYLNGETEGIPNREILLEELMLLWLSNVNPAFFPYQELFDDSELRSNSPYLQLIVGLTDFFEAQEPFGPDNQPLVAMLRSPAMAVPHSLTGQLEYIREKWGYLLGEYFFRLLTSLDLVREEEKRAFMGPGPSIVSDYSGLALEVERFSPDKDWMPRVVILAKNSYVWLDQLSKKYARPIERLDQIPDEELDLLQRWGMTGLWLIGLWERSPASRAIKHAMGNPDAVASAYSLLDYQIASDLGGGTGL